MTHSEFMNRDIMSLTPRFTAEGVFMRAAVCKYRFPNVAGNDFSAEDLFDLSDEELDTIYKGLNTEKHQRESEESLSHHVDCDVDLNAKLEIIRDVFNYRKRKADLEEADRKAADLLKWAKETQEIAKDGVTKDQLDIIIRSNGRRNPFVSPMLSMLGYDIASEYPKAVCTLGESAESTGDESDVEGEDS